MPDKTLQRETLSSFELWQRLRSEQRAASSCNPNAILKLVDLLENTQQQWRTSAQEARRLLDLNDRLKKQNENFSKALEESREYGREMDAKFAAANAQIESLRGELENHKLILQTAGQELQNVTIRHSTLSRQSSYDDQENMEDGQPGHSRGRHLSKSRDRRDNKRQSCSREQPSGKRAKQQHMVERISEEGEFDGKKKKRVDAAIKAHAQKLKKKPEEEDGMDEEFDFRAHLKHFLPSDALIEELRTKSEADYSDSRRRQASVELGMIHMHIQCGKQKSDMSSKLFAGFKILPRSAIQSFSDAALGDGDTVTSSGSGNMPTGQSKSTENGNEWTEFKVLYNAMVNAELSDATKVLGFDDYIQQIKKGCIVYTAMSVEYYFFLFAWGCNYAIDAEQQDMVLQDLLIPANSAADVDKALEKFSENLTFKRNIKDVTIDELREFRNGLERLNEEWKDYVKESPCGDLTRNQQTSIVGFANENWKSLPEHEVDKIAEVMLCEDVIPYPRSTCNCNNCIYGRFLDSQ